VAYLGLDTVHVLTTQPNRPHGWSINANNTIVRWLKLRKPIAWNIAISGNNNYVHDNKIDATYNLDKPAAFPFNTDGYDVKGNNVTFDGNWVFNGDDCVAGKFRNFWVKYLQMQDGEYPFMSTDIAVNGGNGITIKNMFCAGGHGASISAATGVNNVLFDNITSHNCLYASTLHHLAP